jgi:Flp pilus assembly protein TadG
VARFLRPSNADGDKGATLVEFALIAPLLILLLLGIVEFGWKFGQFNDVRHAAREGARFAAVNAGTAADAIDVVCGAMDTVSAGITSVTVTVTDGPTGSRGETATIEVVADVASLTGAPIISVFLPDELKSEIDFRLEQDSTAWTDGTDTCP